MDDYCVVTMSGDDSHIDPLAYFRREEPRRRLNSQPLTGRSMSPTEGFEREDSREQSNSQALTGRSASAFQVFGREELREESNSPPAVGRPISTYTDYSDEGHRSPGGAFSEPPEANERNRIDSPEEGAIIAPRPCRPEEIEIPIMSQMHTSDEEYRVSEAPSVSSNDIGEWKERGTSIFEPEGLGVQRLASGSEADGQTPPDVPPPQVPPTEIPLPETPPPEVPPPHVSPIQVPSTPERPAEDDDGDRTPRATQTRTLPDPDTPTLRAYKLEPPRVGPGFNNLPAPQPPHGSRERSQLFVRPYSLPDGEARDIAKMYDKMYGDSEDTRASLLPSAHRYPPPRDEAARLRKENFEKYTGESMSDEDYYALFDLETASDGMISGLQEWMQGRVWVKVPFVNRIIHQVGRLMYTSAQEEARLRARWRSECDSLRQEIWDSKREAVGLDVLHGRAEKLGIIRQIWSRINDILLYEDTTIRRYMWTWAKAQEEVEKRLALSIVAWNTLCSDFIGLLDERDQLERVVEGAIETGGQIWTQDLGRLKELDERIEAVFRDYVEWQRERTVNIISRIQVGIEDSESARSLSDVHRALDVEKRLLERDILEVKRIAEAQHQVRVYRAKPKPDAVGASDPRPDSIKCQALEREVEDLKGRLEESDRKIKAMTKQHDEARRALDLISNDKIEAALGHIDAYRDLIHTDMHESAGYLSEMLQSVGSRVEEQTSRLRDSLDYLQNGGQPGDINRDLQSLNHSVHMMGESTLLIQSRLTKCLDDMKKHKKTRYATIEKEDPYSAERREGLIRSMRAHIEELEREILRLREVTEDPWTSIQFAQSLERQLKVKTDKLRSKIKHLRGRLEKQEEGQPDADANDESQAKATQGKGDKIRLLKRKCAALEGEVQRVQEKFRQATSEKDSALETLEALQQRASELEVELEERNESETWTLWDGVPTVAAGSDPDDQRMNQVLHLRKGLLQAMLNTQLDKVEKKRKKGTLRRVFKSVFKNAILPKNHRGERKPSGQNETGETTENDVETFWRLVTFQRTRGEIVAALRRGNWDKAIGQLNEAKKWEEKEGTWKIEAYGSEISRSLNYLRAYAHMKKGEVQRLSGQEKASVDTLMYARDCLSKANNIPVGEETPETWVALGTYLEKQAEESAKLVNQFDPKDKSEASRESEEDQPERGRKR